MANYQFKPENRAATYKIQPQDPYRKVMPRRSLGQTGITCGEVGLGSRALGSRSIPDSEAEFIISSCLDMEAKVLDTAPSYGEGRAERLIGRALQGRRREAILCTKAGFDSVRGFDFSETFVRSSLEGSLQRLGTDFVDLLLLHNPPTDLLDRSKPIWQLLVQLEKEGKIRAFGACVTGSAQIRQALEKTDCQVLEFPFHVFDQEAAAAFAAAAIKGVGLIACSPLAGGVLAGRKTPTQSPWARAERSLEFVATPGVRMSQACIQFVLAHPEVSCTIPGASDWHQVIDNVTACQNQLPDEHLKALRAVRVEA